MFNFPNPEEVHEGHWGVFAKGKQIGEVRVLKDGNKLNELWELWYELDDHYPWGEQTICRFGILDEGISVRHDRLRDGEESERIKHYAYVVDKVQDEATEEDLPSPCGTLRKLLQGEKAVGFAFYTTLTGSKESEAHHFLNTGFDGKRCLAYGKPGNAGELKELVVDAGAFDPDGQYLKGKFEWKEHKPKN